MFHVKCILHPTDFSECSQPAFAVACALARDYGARLVVMHVLERIPVTMGGVMAAPPPVLSPEERETAQQKLQQLYAKDSDIRVEHRLEEGDTLTAILQVTQELQSDLIVIGSHGRTGLSRLIMGSIAEKVMRQSPCPVLVVKKPAA